MSSPKPKTPKLNSKSNTDVDLANLQEGEDSVERLQQSADKTGGQVYDPLIADQAVRFERIAKDKRFWKALSTLSTLASVAAVDKLRQVPGRKTKGSQADNRRRNARLVKQALIEMGATFIKLGQFLSVRKDIISEELAEELVSLQDRVPPFEIEVLRQTIERELGAPPEQLFKEFDPTPIASASIGQVHRARLQDGRPVVVKVQRPDLAEIFYQDLGYMRFIARIGPVIRPSQACAGLARAHLRTEGLAASTKEKLGCRLRAMPSSEEPVRSK